MYRMSSMHTIPLHRLLCRSVSSGPSRTISHIQVDEHICAADKRVRTESRQRAPETVVWVTNNIFNLCVRRWHHLFRVIIEVELTGATCWGHDQPLWNPRRTGHSAKHWFWLQMGPPYMPNHLQRSGPSNPKKMSSTTMQALMMRYEMQASHNCVHN